jgi:hypothetical protein
MVSDGLFQLSGVMSQYVFRHHLCIPKNHLMMAYLRRNM